MTDVTGTAAVRLEFWFEFASPYSYPAAMRVEEMSRAAGVPLIWRPFLLGPVFAQLGMEESPFILNPVKGAYMWRDLERVCATQGIAFRKPSVFPRGSLLAARIACAFAEAPWVGAFVRVVYEANFARDADIGSSGVIEACLRSLDLNTNDIIKVANRPETKDALRCTTEAALERHVFGAPTMIVGEELFWGNDRLEMALTHALSAGQARNARP